MRNDVVRLRSVYPAAKPTNRNKNRPLLNISGELLS